MPKQLMILKGMEMGDTFLKLPPSTTKAEFATVANKVVNIGHGFLWWLGDLANYAEHFLDEKSVEELCNASGYEKSHIRTLGKVCSKFKVRERIIGLSLTHHMLVMHLMPLRRQQILKKAKDKSWSCTKLQKYVTPKDEREFMLRMRIPAAKRSKKFFTEVQALCDRYTAEFSIVGEVRASHLRRAGKPLIG